MLHPLTNVSLNAFSPFVGIYAHMLFNKLEFPIFKKHDKKQWATHAKYQAQAHFEMLKPKTANNRRYWDIYHVKTKR